MEVTDEFSFQDDSAGLRIPTESPFETGGGGDDESACGSFVAGLIWFISILLIICTFPFSLCVCVRMVQVSKDIIVNFIKSLKTSYNPPHTYIT